MKFLFVACFISAQLFGCASSSLQHKFSGIYTSPEEAYVYELDRKRPGLYDVQASIDYLKTKQAVTMIDLNFDGINEFLVSSEDVIISEHCQIPKLDVLNNDRQIMTGDVFNKYFVLLRQDEEGWSVMAIVQGHHVHFMPEKSAGWPDLEVRYHAGITEVRKNYRWDDKSASYYELDPLYSYIRP